MFYLNKYTKWYYRIIEKARSEHRIKTNDNYFESHHIIPLACGGSNSFTNIILLTGREHFTAHLLLTKMVIRTDYKRKMLLSLQRMCHSNRFHQRCVTSRQYEWVRKKLSEGSRGSDNHFYGKRHTDESKQKISKGNKGKKVSQETRDLISKNHAKAGGHRGKMWIYSIITHESRPISTTDIIPNGWAKGRKMKTR